MERITVIGFGERIERMGNGLLSTDSGNGLNGWERITVNGFGERIERIERIGERITVKGSGNGLERIGEAPVRGRLVVSPGFCIG